MPWVYETNNRTVTLIGSIACFGWTSPDREPNNNKPDHNEPDHNEPDHNEPDHNEPNHNEPDRCPVNENCGSSRIPSLPGQPGYLHHTVSGEEG